MQNAKSISTPLAAYFRLSSALSPQSEVDVDYMSRVPYSSAVESLMYAIICSRLDLSYVVSVVSKYMANPGKEHRKEGKEYILLGMYLLLKVVSPRIPLVEILMITNQGYLLLMVKLS